MPFRDDQIKACFAQANKQEGPKKAKRLSGCKKMVKHKHGDQKEAFERKLEKALIENRV